MRLRFLLSSFLLLGSGLLLVGTVFHAAPSTAKIVSKSKLRKIKKGVGNCVFSTQALPFEKESKYKGVTKSFSTGDVVNVRCYWPGMLKEARKVGKHRNELREENGKYRISLEIKPTATKKKRGKKRKKRKSKKGKSASAEEVDASALAHPVLIALVPASGMEEWDQRDYDLRPDARRCIFPSQYGVSKCLHLEAAVAEQARLVSKDLPFTAEVCLKTYVEYIEKAGQEPREHVLSQGCFKYRASTDGKPAEAPATEAATE